MTPWTGTKPLPLGPMHLCWADVVVPGSLILSESLLSHTNVLLIPAFMLIGYLIPMAIVLLVAEEFVAGYTLLFGFALAMRLGYSLEAVCVVLFVLYGVAMIALHRMLAGYPWRRRVDKRIEDFNRKNKRTSANNDPNQPLSLKKGWPYAHLAPQQVESLPTSHALAVSALAGWWTYVMAEVLQTNGETIDRSILILLVIGFSVARWLAYWFGYLPPVSLRGRLRTGRLIIPGYDRMLIPPIVNAIIGSAMLLVFEHLQWPPSVEASTLMTSLLAYNLLAGPSFAEWRLTGHHRITSIAPCDPRLNLAGPLSYPGEPLR